MKALLVGPAVLLVCAIFSSAGGQTPSPSAKAMSDAGIEGNISISPSHPGPVRADRPSTAALPTTDFVVKKDGEQVSAFATDAEGNFRVALPPGHYVVELKERRQSRIGHFGPWEVDVAAGKLTRVDWVCDTGMR